MWYSETAWIEKVSVKETELLHNEHKCVLLILSGSQTHVTLENVEKYHALGVHIVLPPPHLNDVVQPLDRAVFCPLKKAFTKLGKKTRGNTPKDFFWFFTKACVTSIESRSQRRRLV